MLTSEQRKEIIKLQRIIKQYEGILKMSKDAESIIRIKKDLQKANENLDLLCPNGVPGDLIYQEEKPAPKGDVKDLFKRSVILSNFPIQKASPNCDDNDVNILTTIIRVWDSEFLPALTEHHVKLDFSTSAERDSHFRLLEEIKRQIKIVGDSTENHHSAVREDIKTRLNEVRNRHVRNFLIDGLALIRKIRNFWSGLLQDIKTDSIQCMNPKDTIQLNTAFETATYLSGETVSKAIEIACLFLDEGIGLIKPPTLDAK